MRYAHAAPGWSRYDIGAHELDALAAQVVELAAAMGFEIPESCVRGVKLMKRGDALAIEIDGVGAGGNAGRHYVEYPMVERDGPTDPVTLKANAADRILAFLHEQRWLQERRRVTAGITANDMLEHQDGDTLSRWARAMKRHDPARIGGLRLLPIQFRQFDHECHAAMRTAAGKVRIEGDSIILPMVLPETFKGISLRPLGRIVEFPTCGDADLDAEIAGVYVHDIETVEATTTRRASTRIRLPTQNQRPLAAGDSVWRRLRGVRPIITGRPPEYLEPDVAAGAAAYHADCAAATGHDTQLPIRLKVAA